MTLTFLVKIMCNTNILNRQDKCMAITITYKTIEYGMIKYL